MPTIKHLKNRVRKLHLERGDIIVCADPNTMKLLSGLQVDIPFPIPIVFAPEGLEKVSYAELKRVMKVAEQAFYPSLIIPGAMHAAQSK